MLESIREELHKLKTDWIMLVACLLIPISVNFLIGWQLQEGSIKQVPMAVVDQDQSQLSRELISYFETNEAFKMKEQVDSQKALQQLLDNSQIKVGMVIPKDFAADVVDLKSPTILMLYDGSHMSMTSVAKAKANEILLTMRVGASIKHIETRLSKGAEEAYNMAMPVQFEARTLYNPTKSFEYFMLPGYGTIICQLGIALTAVLCVNFPREKEKTRKVPRYIVGKVLFYGCLGSIAISINSLVQIYVFKVPCKGDLLAVLGMGILFVFAVAALAVALSAWFHNRVLVMAIAGLLLIPNSIMAGYTWPVLAMVPFYKWMSWFIPFTHYGDNVRDLFLKGYMVNPAHDLTFLIGFTLIMVMMGILGTYIELLRKPREVDPR